MVDKHQPLLLPQMALWMVLCWGAAPAAAAAAGTGHTRHTPESLELSLLPHGSKLVSEGSSHILNCRALGPGPDGGRPRLSWITPEGREVTDLPGRLYVHRGYYTSHLYITSVSQEDAGIFTCRVTDDHHRIINEEHIKLDIYQPITYVDCPLVQQFPVHTARLIKCQVEASPAVVISWKFNGHYVYDGSTYSQERNGLQIHNVSSATAGQYTCTSEITHLGIYRRRHITVLITGSPEMEKDGRR
ncbi:contactin-3-like [Argonauta hians]